MTSGAGLRIGISACYFPEDRTRPVFNGKALFYVERGMARWVGSSGALAYLVPGPESDESAAALAADLDGLVLAGGVDVCPRSYGEEPARPEWEGDAARDEMELSLLRAVLALDKPVLGVCRGHQLLNVAFSGTLYQDISTYVEGSLVHRDPVPYDQNRHDIEIVAGSTLCAVYGGLTRANVNSVHHQAIKQPGRGVEVEARSSADGVIEAMRVRGPSYARGVQWHPEFAHPTPPDHLSSAPLLSDFLSAARRRKAPAP